MIFIDQYKNCYTIDFRATKSKYICPVCGATRRNKKDRSLYINRNSHVGKCYNCDAVLFEHNEADNLVKEYKQPKELQSKLSKSVVEWFAGRGISESSLNHLKITNGEVIMPPDNLKVNAICFNYYKSKKPINIKYRDKDKHFKFETDCEVTFYNYDALIEFDKIIITEGEIDALSFVEAGLFNVVSLPNGCKNIKFIDQYIFDVERVKEWILCLDKDEGGLSARHELMCKLGIEKCRVINTKDCKDANSFLVTYGKKELQNIYSLAEKIVDSEPEFDFHQIFGEAEINLETNVAKRDIILGEIKPYHVHGLPEVIEILSAGNLSMISGKAKSRKTFASMFLIAKILKPGLTHVSDFKNGIVLFDTEQFRDHSARFIKRLFRLSGIDNFMMFNLRAYKKAERLKFIKTYIEKCEPSLAIIDNIRDVLKNFNDIEQSDDVLTELTNLAETTATHICCTLHANKGDNNARGHLGSELTIKAETVFFIETIDSYTTISPSYTRNEPFREMKFEIIDGLPVEVINTIPANFNVLPKEDPF